MIIKTIRDILGGRPLHHVAPETTLREAAQMMERHDVGALAVLEGGRLAGILSERDLVRRGVGQGLAPERATAAQVMTRDPVTVGADDALSDALAARIGGAFRHLPVMEGEQVVGLLSYRDIPAEYLALFERFHEMSTAKADEAP
ncbi:MAG: CBS domain-containing protein [Paracoccaceae bacterium]